VITLLGLTLIGVGIAGGPYVAGSAISDWQYFVSAALFGLGAAVTMIDLAIGFRR
jgi:hypothetical protein